MPFRITVILLPAPLAGPGFWPLTGAGQATHTWADARFTDKLHSTASATALIADRQLVRASTSPPICDVERFLGLSFLHITDFSFPHFVFLIKRHSGTLDLIMPFLSKFTVFCLWLWNYYPHKRLGAGNGNKKRGIFM